MSTPRITHWWHGFLLMELRGQSVSEALRAFQQEGIELYYVKVRSGRSTLGISRHDFASFYSICRQHGVKIRFIKKEGFPFLAKRWAKRKCMIAGFGLFLSLVYGMSAMIWQVSVTGVDEEAQATVLQAAKECGLYPGAWKGPLEDVQVIQNRLLEKIPSLVWVGVQVEGSKAKLEALEKIPNTEKIDATPHNLIAAKPAVIRYVYATRGQSLVKPGQVVHPGQIVISGNLGEGVKSVPATGRVLAEVWYTSKVEMPLQVIHSGLTGAFVNRDYLMFGSATLRVWGWQQPDYKSTYEQSNDTDFHLGNWAVPIQLRKVTVYEAFPEAVSKSEQSAEQSAIHLAAQDVRRHMAEEGEILTQTVLHREVSHGKLYETILTRTEEDIGVAAAMEPVQEELPSSQPHS